MNLSIRHTKGKALSTPRPCWYCPAATVREWDYTCIHTHLHHNTTQERWCTTCFTTNLKTVLNGRGPIYPRHRPRRGIGSINHFMEISGLCQHPSKRFLNERMLRLLVITSPQTSPVFAKCVVKTLCLLLWKPSTSQVCILRKSTHKSAKILVWTLHTVSVTLVLTHYLYTHTHTHTHRSCPLDPTRDWHEATMQEKRGCDVQFARWTWRWPNEKNRLERHRFLRVRYFGITTTPPTNVHTCMYVTSISLPCSLHTYNRHDIYAT